MRSFLLALSVVLTASPAFGVALDGFFSRERLWSTSQTEFEHLDAARPFRWTSATRDSARAGETDLTLFNMPAAEAVGRFADDKLKELTVTFYARGDAKEGAAEMSREKFEGLIRSVTEAVSAFTKTKFAVRGKDATSAVKAEGLTWQSPVGNFLLEYSFTREVKSRDIPFRAEFIRLEITPPQRTVSLLASAANTAQAKFSGPTHVKRDLASGDVKIEGVPMVDQGQKGYCAVACTERVMRYYGVQVDANELAQVANSDADHGTNAETMFEALKKLGARLRVRVRPIEQFSVRSFTGLIGDYNRAAKKGGRAPALADPGLSIDVGGIYRQMQPEVLRDVRNKSKSDVDRFQRSIASSVDQGIPVLWSVMLGLVEEKPKLPQSFGGHMRLIIGYNTRTQEILYTDSWGFGHELKRMSLADAWTITVGTTSIEPI